MQGDWKMVKIIHCSGKRKTAIARATLKQGNGVVKINNRLISTIKPEALRMRLEEPLILAGDVSSGVNLSVNVIGGGAVSQAEAARLAIARALAKYTKKLEKVFLNYDPTPKRCCQQFPYLTQWLTASESGFY